MEKETVNELDYINKRINNEICYDTIKKLSDSELLEEYKQTNSLKQRITELECILEKYVNEDIKNNIINDYLLQLIPAGTKGVIRGNKFNKIIRNYILNLNLNSESYDICFEQNCSLYKTSEIPDWFIIQKRTNKIIIGMNQIDLWSGGHQLNRGSKYLNINSSNVKFLCVVCNKIQFKSKTTKAYKLFQLGFLNNTLCYLNGLKKIIFDYFNEFDIEQKSNF